MAKPITKAQKLKDDNLMQYAEQIVTKMRVSDTVFTDPVPGLLVIEEAFLTYLPLYKNLKSIPYHQSRL